MTEPGATPFVLVHADESCLGNQFEGPNPGGAAALVELRTGDGIERRDFYIASPNTTNNQMALTGAVELLKHLSTRGDPLDVYYVSDSQYLVKGMNEWVPGWRAGGWRRRGGAVQNLELWQALARQTERQQVRWHWVRGHAGHAKNEYANDLAVQAAKTQGRSAGIEPSAFAVWLARRRATGQLATYNPDTEFETLEKLRTGGR